VTGTAPASLERLVRGLGYVSGTVGVQVVCLESGQEAARLSADSLFVPASVAKLVTAAAAFEILGQTYTFKTRVFIEGGLALDSGVTRGSLYIRGGGDPGFIAERVWLLVQHLRLRGVHRIAGDCVLDGSFFDSSTTGPGFDDDASSRAYEAPVGALSANFNCLEVHCQPLEKAGEPIRVELFPQAKGVPVLNTARTVAASGGPSLDVRTEQRQGRTTVLVDGSMPLGSQPRIVYRKAWETAEEFGRVLAAQFDACGISVNGTVRCGSTPDTLLGREPFYTFESFPLPQCVAYLFKYSQNGAAEMIYRTIAAERAGGKNGSWDSAAAIVGRWWRDNGLPGALDLHNGSGMGRCNRLSPVQLVALLRHVWQHASYYPDYLGALSCAGFDGTLKERFAASRLKGFLRGKTGTLNNVGASTLAGYALVDGRTYAYAILINDTAHSAADHWRLEERILESVLP
jgi:D-alanyl-D-alanine carboxypeptidase/D-alanyl-D-alanine-endopeptidase (penicillin-binding protein 4)